MDLGLKGRTALVTGASSGLGLATAEALAAEGANVSMFARRRDLLEREADRIGALATRGDVTIPKDLAPELPRLLWLYHMGIILFWIHDSSNKRSRTYRLIDQTVDLLDKLISLASNPLMRPVRKRALKLVADLRDLEAAEVEAN